MRDTFLVFGSPMIEEEEIQEVVATLRSGWLGTGPKVHQFEEMFREYTGARYAMALHSCTAALHLSMIAARFSVAWMTDQYGENYPPQIAVC